MGYPFQADENPKGRKAGRSPHFRIPDENGFILSRNPFTAYDPPSQEESKRIVSLLQTVVCPDTSCEVLEISRPEPCAATMMDYRFRPISKTCAGTGNPLVPGSLCYSVLVERHGQQERLDFSSEGWSGIPEDAVGFWKCHVPVPAPRQVATTDPETLLKYFEQLVEAGNPHHEKLAFVLALYLLQRRRLKLDGSQERDGVEYLELSGSRGEGPYEVRDQQISEAEMTLLRQTLDQQLTAGGEAA